VTERPRPLRRLWRRASFPCPSIRPAA